MIKRFFWPTLWRFAGIVGIAATVGACGRLTPALHRESADWPGQAFAAGQKTQLVAVNYQNASQLTKLADSGMDVWGVDSATMRAFGVVMAAQIPLLRKLGLKVAPAPPPLHANNDFDKGYHTYETLLPELQALVAKHPEIAELVSLGPSWETSQGKADRQIWGVHLRLGEAEAKPGVVFVGAHHAREIVTPEICLRLVSMLVEGYGTDPELTAAVETRDIWIVPMVNPDGHNRAAHGDDWRKNTDPETAQPLGVLPILRAWGPGVDLNRNYTFHWGEGGASTKPESPTFRGKGAGSEPEVQAVMKLVSSRKFTYLVTYHSFSNLILWPWGYSDNPPPDDRLPAIGKKLGALSGYRPQQSKDLYRTSGDTTDWAFGSQGVLAYTTEIGTWNDGFDPPFKRVAEFWKQNEPGARYLLKTADNPGAVFGPELRIVNGRVEAPRGAVVEAYADRLGKPGAGVRVDGNIPAFDGRRRLVYLQARIGDRIGPAAVVWSK